MLNFMFEPSEKWVIFWIGSVFLPYVIVSIVWVIQTIWEWTDDFDKPSRNWFIYFIATKVYRCEHRGYTYDNHPYTSDGDYWSNADVLCWTLIHSFGICFVGLILGWLILFYPSIALSLSITAGILFLVRFVKRLSKKLNKHLDNHN